MGFESVKKIAEADFPTRWGAFRILGFEGVLAAGAPLRRMARLTALAKARLRAWWPW